MARGDKVLSHMRKICLALPDTEESETWGKPHFRVRNKIFAGCGEEDGRRVIGFKLEMDHATRLVRQPHVWRAPYVGHKGWVSMDASAVDDWAAVRDLVLESYRLIAPKTTLKKLDEAAGARPAKARKAASTVRKKGGTVSGAGGKTTKKSPATGKKKSARKKAARRPER